MAKKKKTKKQAQTQVKPEQYIKTRVRQLPIVGCYKTDAKDSGLMNIFVMRQHPKGTLTVGVYLVDTWCVGVKDATWMFNVTMEEINERMFGMSAMLPQEISYVEAHNWIYGALEFAAEVGIKPHQDFAIARYILEEDDDNVELIEYEFGKNGRYCLCTHGMLEASHYMPALNKSLGEGNYELVVLDTPHPYADNYDYNADFLDEDMLSAVDDWIEKNDVDRDWEDNFDKIKTLKHTYKCDTYPSSITLKHPEIRNIVSMNMETIPDSDIENVLSLPIDEVRDDLHQIILYELYRQTGKDSEELDADTSNDWQVIGNSFMFLTKVGTPDETLPVVLEVLRQNNDFINFNFGDFANVLVFPVIYALCKDKPSRLLDFLLEEGLDAYAKIIIIEYITAMGFHMPEIRQEVVDMARTLFYEYRKDFPQIKICDGHVIAFVISMATKVGAKDLLPEIKEIYSTGLVYQGLMGSFKSIEKYMNSPRCSTDLPPTEPIAIRDLYEKETRPWRK